MALTIQTQDKGIIAGSPGLTDTKGIYIYEPQSDIHLNEGSSRNEFESVLPRDTSKWTNIPYSMVRKVNVDKTTVWRNLSDFPDAKHKDQKYIGRGDIEVEFREDANQTIIEKQILTKSLDFVVV